MGGTPNKLFIKNCVFFPCLNLSPLQSTLQLMQQTYPDFPLIKTVLNLSILMPFSASAFVCLCHLFHIGKTFPFEDFFHWGN